MTRNFCLFLTLACLSCGAMLAGCEADESQPTQPRTRNIWALDPKAQENAENRATEAPSRPLPDTGNEVTGKEESRAAKETPASAQVVTLQASVGGNGGDAQGVSEEGSSDHPAADSDLSVQRTALKYLPAGRCSGQSRGPTTVYKLDPYTGPIPHIPANPGTVPMAGSTLAPGGDWDVDYSTGQALVLLNAPHRPWPEVSAMSQSGDTKHNPLYYFNIQEHLNVPQPTGTNCSDWISELYEIPWFYLNTIIVPVLMPFWSLHWPRGRRRGPAAIRISGDTCRRKASSCRRRCPASCAGPIRFSMRMVR